MDTSGCVIWRSDDTCVQSENDIAIRCPSSPTVNKNGVDALLEVIGHVDSEIADDVTVPIRVFPWLQSKRTDRKAMVELRKTKSALEDNSSVFTDGDGWTIVVEKPMNVAVVDSNRELDETRKLFGNGQQCLQSVGGLAHIRLSLSSHLCSLTITAQTRMARCGQTRVGGYISICRTILSSTSDDTPGMCGDSVNSPHVGISSDALQAIFRTAKCIQRSMLMERCVFEKHDWNKWSCQSRQFVDCQFCRTEPDQHGIGNLNNENERFVSDMSRVDPDDSSLAADVLAHHRPGKEMIDGMDVWES
ncbi:hypothetical protein BLNAU_18365 [Blattamonas nauphoetae]|uniref:Uncharacterized protein n=1 Tax=Blattamonas nauphoetae TaxID=2049346 RepID=A0ABQ9X520_9EUKA|nr:hypothetical protein BLNAU_18365 [Blattamonas nauphoetae]